MNKDYRSYFKVEDVCNFLEYSGMHEGCEIHNWVGSLKVIAILFPHHKRWNSDPVRVKCL